MAGWWRRNRWGVVALVPVLAATVGLYWGDAYDQYWKGDAREPVTAGGDGWVEFGGARMRLTALGPGTDLTDFAGKRYQPPKGTAVWRATIAFDAPKPDEIGGCELELADSAGHTYEANPAELTDTRAGYASCIPSFEDKDKTKFQSTAYFIAPAAVRPAGVRVTLRSQYPRYALLRL